MGSVVISDVVSDTTRFPYTMLGRQAHPHSHPHPHPHPHSHPHAHPSRQASPVESTYRPSAAQPTPPTSTPSSTSVIARDPRSSASLASSYAPHQSSPVTPPSSTHPPARASSGRASSSSQRQALLDPAQSSVTAGSAYMGRTPPHDPSLARLSSSADAATRPHQSSPSQAATGSPSQTGHRIKVRSLAHIQQLARDEVIQTRPPSATGRSRRRTEESGAKFELSEMPVADVIEMVAGLLTKITTTNDRQHEHLHRHIPPPESATGLSQQTSSVLAFHGKNVPSITILSYLSRIHKYCPTTYEVFLSLLVYFDRMTERVNSRSTEASGAEAASSNEPGHRRQQSRSSEMGGRRPSFAERQSRSRPTSMGSTAPVHEESGAFIVPEPSPRPDAVDLSQFFVVDSFNIHRLVIAGVTCASKFFSDVFYTNSRYAKVGGLPVVELNHLEIQFLLLNDFRLLVPVEELEAYGTMLVEFYARESAALESEQMEGIIDSDSEQRRSDEAGFGTAA